jgi:hypothetical protein
MVISVLNHLNCRARVQVATRFLAAVKESSGPGLNMAFFISCDPEDVMRQAEESTLRYQRGNNNKHFFLLSEEVALSHQTRQLLFRRI